MTALGALLHVSASVLTAAFVGGMVSLVAPSAFAYGVIFGVLMAEMVNHYHYHRL